MKLYTPVYLPFADVLKEHTKKIMNSICGQQVHVSRIPITNEERDKFNRYLASKGVSPLRNVLAFKRNMPNPGYQDCHLDVRDEGLVNCSVVIPVDGCKDSKQYWYDGDYTIEIRRTIQNAPYGYANWKSPANFIGEVEIYDQPMLVRTNIPHSAYCGRDEYRITCTIRFEGNESFEYLKEHLSK